MTAPGERIVPIVDLQRRMAHRRDAIVTAVDRVIASGAFLLGPELSAFESAFARSIGRPFVVGVGSGTDALRLTLTALGIGPGDEVLVPAFTAVPTVAAVCAAGATPVPVDVDPETAALDLPAAAAAVTPSTRAVIVVHLYGRPAPLPDFGVPVIEDAAQAHGARLPAGSVAAAYSFYPTKNLGGIGDGGAVATDDEGLAQRIIELRHHGMGPDYRHDVVSTNSRMSEIEAAVLTIGLGYLDKDNERRRAIADHYREIAPQRVWHANHPEHVHHLCVLREHDRDVFRSSVPFATAVHYPRAITQQPAYERFVRSACPHAESWAAECVTVPCFPEMTDDEVEIVCGGLR